MEANVNKKEDRMRNCTLQKKCHVNWNSHADWRKDLA